MAYAPKEDEPGFDWRVQGNRMRGNPKNPGKPDPVYSAKHGGRKMPGLGDLPRALLPGKKRGEAGVGDVMRSLAGQLTGRKKSGAVKTAGVGKPTRVMPGTPAPKSGYPYKPITTGMSSQEARGILKPKKKGGMQTAGQQAAIREGLNRDLNNP